VRGATSLLLALACVSVLVASFLPTPPAPQVSAKPEVKYRFRYVQPTRRPPVHFNIFVSGAAGGAGILVFEPLFVYHRGNGTYIPVLGVSWTLSEDCKVLTVKLRKGVTFSDGTPFTSKDVITTWYCGYLVHWWHWKYLDRVEAPDDYTVVFYAKEPWPLMPFYVLTRTIVSDSQYGEWAEKVIEYLKAGKTEELKKLEEEFRKYRPEKYVGTGPFEFAACTAEGTLYRKRATYWRGIDKVHFDEFFFVNLAGPPEFAAILSLAFDYVTPDLTKAIYEQIKEIPSIWVFGKPPLKGRSWRHGHALYFNTRRYPLSLVEVRRAIAYAINRTAYCIACSPSVETAFPLEYPVPLCRLKPNSLYDWIPEDVLAKYFKKYEYDPNKAIKIFEELGFKRGPDGIWVTPNGTRLSFELVAPCWTDWALGAEFLKSELAKVGIEIKLTILREWGTMCDRVRRGDYDIFIWFWTHFLPRPFDCFNRWAATPEGDPVGLRNKVFDTPWGKYNFSEAVAKIGSALTRDEIVKYTTICAWIINNYLNVLPLREKPATFCFNVETVAWPSPDDPWWDWVTTDDGAVYWGITVGLLKPKALIRYIRVWFTEEVEAFYGVDAKKYGPFKPGDSALLPTEDADRLVAQGLASYTPPLPKELEAAIESTKEAVEKLSKSVEELEGVVRGMTSLLYATIVLEVIIIAIAAMIALKVVRTGTK